jgi:hypothetical protein
MNVRCDKLKLIEQLLGKRILHPPGKNSRTKISAAVGFFVKRCGRRFHRYTQIRIQKFFSLLVDLCDCFIAAIFSFDKN